MKSKIVKENNYTIFYLQYSEFGVLTYYKHALQRNNISISLKFNCVSATNISWHHLRPGSDLNILSGTIAPTSENI